MPRARSPQIVDRRLRLGLQLRQHLVRLRRVAVDQRVGQPQLHAERDELLLRAVVDVALELASFLVLRGHQALT